MRAESRLAAIALQLHLEGDDEIREMFSRPHGLFVVTKFKIFRVRSPDDLDPTSTTPDVPWEQTMHLAFGASDPFVARTIIQTDRLSRIFFAKNSTEYTSMMDVSWEVLNSVVSIRVIYERLKKRVDEIIAVINDDIDRYREGRSPKPLPALEFYDIEFRSFVNEVRRVLSNISQLFEILTPINIDGGHFHKALEWAIKERGKDSVLAQMLAGDLRWIKLWIDMRIAIEHPKKDNYIETSNFSLEADRTIRLPTWRFINSRYDMGRPQNLLDVFGICIENVLKFFEDLQLVLTDGHAPDWVGVGFETLEEDSRDPDCPMRLRFEPFIRARSGNTTD